MQASISETETRLIEARGIDQTFEIRIGHPVPSPMGPPADDYPVLYVLDGDLFWATAVELSRIMQLFGEMPPMVVVGIGYGDREAQGQLRNRDFTPTRDEGFERMAPPEGGDFEFLLPEHSRYGGAAAFQAFLADQVRPLVHDMFPVRAGSQTVYGSSLGGLLAMHTLLTAPSTFDNYIIASPSLWWDDERLFAIEREQATRGEPLEAGVYLGVGALEQGTGMPWLDALKMVTNVRAMAERLRARGDTTLRLSEHVFEDETHTSVIAAVMTRGMRALVGNRR